MSEPARKILLQLCGEKLPESGQGAMLFFEAMAESATIRFCEAAHLDLQILTVLQRVGIAYSRLKQFASLHGARVSYDLKRWGLILLHGEEKGKRLSDIALAARWNSKDAAK